MYHNKSHRAADGLLRAGYRVNIDTGEILTPDGEPLPIVGNNRPRVEVTLSGYTYHIHQHKLVAYVVYGADTFKPGYSVHHINGNRYDNRARNLRVMSIEDHAALHGYTPKAASVQ